MLYAKVLKKANKWTHNYILKLGRDLKIEYITIFLDFEEYERLNIWLHSKL